jgi:hypothetical protein
MSIPTPPLAFVGWFFAIVSFAALAIGILLRQLFRSGRFLPSTCNRASSAILRCCSSG